MQSDFLNELKTIDNYTYTENGAIAYRSTGNKVLDAFGSLAAMPFCEPEEILDTFYAAFSEDRKLAMRLLFYVRDIRGGQGMRRVFRIIVRNLAFTNPDIIINNFDNFLFFGRGDDLLSLLDTPVHVDVIDFIGDTLLADVKAVNEGGSCSLLAKWLPSENTSSESTRRLAKEIRWGLDMTSKEYRKTLSMLRKEIGIVESKMSANKWDEIDFSKLPSKAAMIYADAFLRQTEETYKKYLQDLAEGNAKVNAGALFPVDIVHKVMDYNVSLANQYLTDAMWKALPNYFGDTEETGLCVVDTSGSMSGTPMEVAISLGLYCADKAKGPFKNHFITFSGNPRLQEINGNNIFEKVRNMESSDWGMNTDVEAVFNLILKTALSASLKQEDLPSKLYIISDMQFDDCAYKGDRWDYRGERKQIKPESLIETMRCKFAAEGYTMPALVFWNVRASKCGMYQLPGTDGACCMVSGYSPSLFKSVIDGTDYVEEVNAETGEVEVKQKIDPITVMTRTLMNERYDRVYVGE